MNRDTETATTCLKDLLGPLKSLGQALKFLLASVSMHRSRIKESGIMVNTLIFLRCLDLAVSRYLLSIYSSVKQSTEDFT